MSQELEQAILQLDEALSALYDLQESWIDKKEKIKETVDPDIFEEFLSWFQED